MITLDWEAHIDMEPQKDLNQRAWLALSSECSEYCDHWICDETWCHAIKRSYPSLINVIKFDHGQLKHALNSIVGMFNESNNRGIYEETSTWNVHSIERRGLLHSITTA